MIYWDSSAIVPMLVSQANSAAMLNLYRADPDMITWWGTYVECYSALMRLGRENILGSEEVRKAENRLTCLRDSWTEVLPLDSVRKAGLRMLRIHPLRAADALQLAAAMTASGHEPEHLKFLSFDERLNAAAEREGFPIEKP